jgi:hypothetical protein
MLNTKVNPPAVKDLSALAAQICAAHLAVGRALGNALDHAMTAGDALIAARGQVKHGEWAFWLKRHCDLHERVARRYVQLAKARPVLEAKQTRESVLTLGVALKFIGEAKSANGSSSSQRPAKPVLSTLAWSEATPEQRQHFLDGIGLISLLAAIPPAWQAEIERRVAGQRKAKALSDAAAKALRQALSLQMTHRAKDEMAPGVAAALNTINNLLAKVGADLNEISGITLDETRTRHAA